MPVIVTLLYPAVPFDNNYYLTKHMPMVASKWTSKGMTSWQVVELDSSSGYCVECIMEFESKESFAKAMEEDGKEVMSDIPNYTEGKPLQFLGAVTGKS